MSEPARDLPPASAAPLPSFGQQWAYKSGPLPDETQARLAGFGLEWSGEGDDAHPWLLPLLGALCFIVFCLMVLMGRAPWQS